MAAAHVFPDFPDHAFLGAGERIRKRVVASIERLSHQRHGKPLLAAAADVFLLEQGQLQQEKLFEFKPIRCLGQGVLVLRKVDLPKREAQRYQPFFPKHVLRQGLLQAGQNPFQCGAHHFQHDLAGDAAVLEFFRGRIYAGKDAGGLRIRRIHFRMHHVQPPVEQGGLAEEDETAAGKQPAVLPFDSLEKHHFHLPALVCHQHRQAAGHIVLELVCRQLRTVFGIDADFEHSGPHLHIGLVRVHIGNKLDAAAVYVAERIQVQQIAYRSDSQLGAQKLCPFWAHSRQVLYGCIHIHCIQNYKKCRDFLPKHPAVRK